MPVQSILVDSSNNPTGTIGNPSNANIILNGASISVANPIPIADVGQTFSIVTQSVTITAGSSGTCTLSGVAGKTTFLRGFTITSASIAAIVSGLVTITGLTNTFNFQYDNLAVGQSILDKNFGEDGIPASGQNTSIIINFPAITGGGATAIVMWGYQL